METFKSANKITDRVNTWRVAGKKVGFVPTMGALHDGHLSLVRRCLNEQDICLVSIFVNPTQFNEKKDLEAYPRTEHRDLEMLRENGCHAAFVPSVNEVYPKDQREYGTIDLAGLDKTLEGEFRPGHFEGVVEVMQRLLHIIPCNVLYMGQKDWQQTTIVNHMIRQMDMEVSLIRCPTQREKDGLAMSSRNERLSKEDRKRSGTIYRVLNQARLWAEKKKPREIEASAIEYLRGAGLTPEYFKIIDGDTLEGINEWGNERLVVACTAVWAGQVRLIDNMILSGQPQP